MPLRTNYSSDEVVVISFISSLVISGVLLIKTFSTEVYRSTKMNLLEISFLCNLEVLSVTLCCTSYDDVVVCRSTDVSISISFIIFIGRVVYHAHLQIQRTRWYTSAQQAVLSKLPFQQYRQAIPAADDDDEQQVREDTLRKLPTSYLSCATP